MEQGKGSETGGERLWSREEEEVNLDPESPKGDSSEQDSFGKRGPLAYLPASVLCSAMEHKLNFSVRCISQITVCGVIPLCDQSGDDANWPRYRAELGALRSWAKHHMLVLAGKRRDLRLGPRKEVKICK